MKRNLIDPLHRPEDTDEHFFDGLKTLLGPLGVLACIVVMAYGVYSLFA